MKKIVLLLSVIVLLGAHNYDLSDYHHPSGDDVLISTRVPIVSREDAIELGDLLFHKPTSVSRVSCADCHDLRFSGRSVFNKEQGGGLFREKKIESFERIYGNKPPIPIDRKPFKNVTVLNSHRIHRSGKVLHHGAISDFPLEAQIDSATNAHFMQDLVIECRHDAHMQELAQRGFAKELSKDVVRSAISAFEQTLTTSETNASRGKITKVKGFLLFDTMCKDCHFNRVVSKSLANNPIHAEVVPQSLENVWQSAGYFQTSEKISLYKAIKRHDGVHTPKGWLTPSRIRSIKSFLYHDLTDRRYVGE